VRSSSFLPGQGYGIASLRHVRERRGWVVASVLLLLGALAGAGAVREHWLPCRGSMLSGSVVHGYAYGADFSDACLATMDNGFALVYPAGDVRWGAESVLGTGCALLLALAWAVVVVSSPWSRTTRVVAVLPAFANAAAGLLSLLAEGAAVESAFGWLLLSVNLLAVPAFVAVVVRESPDGRATLQAALALCASGAVGVVPSVLDYAFMTSFSDANWDLPPGSGYPTVVTSALLALVLLAVTRRGSRRRSAAGAPVGAS